MRLHQLTTLTLLLIILSVIIMPIVASESISIHKPNLFMLAKGKEVFYPHVVNADGLMTLSYSDASVRDALKQFASQGFNTVRVNVDASHSFTAPLADYQASDGTLNDSIIKRLDLIFDEAETQSLHIILSFFDIQSITEHWKSSPYNRANGGKHKRLSGFFSSETLLGQCKTRVQQLVTRYTSRNILAWELGRGVNAWEFGNIQENDLRKSVPFWVVRTATAIQHADPNKHLVAIGIAPNTNPIDLLHIPFIDLIFTGIHAVDENKTAQFIPRYITMLHDYKKPVFIAEYSWKGKSSKQERFERNTFWASFAMMSGMFAMTKPPEAIVQENAFHVTRSYLSMMERLKFIIKEIDLAGPPRLITAPVLTKPKGTFIVAESIVGYNRIQWIMRLVPGDSKAQLESATVEGSYDVRWFDLESVKPTPPTTFAFILSRKKLLQETPEFERDTLSVLRLIKRAPNRKK